MGGDGGDPENAINGGDGEKSAAVKLDTVIANVGSTVVAQESGVPKPNPTQNLPNNQEQALDQAGATTCPVNNAEVQILAGDIVMSKKTEEIGVVSADLLQFLPVAGNTVKKLIKDEVTVVGRNYSHGEAVSSATQPGKIGLVIGVNKRVDLASSTGAIAHRDIEAQKLKRTQSLFVGDVVITRDTMWIGEVVDVELRVKVKIEEDGMEIEEDGMEIEEDGMEIVRLSPDPEDEEGFKPIYANSLEESIKHPYYVGQAIDCFSIEFYGRKRGYVVEQDVQFVTINWLMTRLRGGTEEPPKVHTPTKLRLFQNPRFVEAEWRIGEPCSLDDDQVYLIVNLRTRVRVRWQDGYTDEVDGLQVVPLDNAEALFFCGQIVLKKGEVDDEGVVMSVVGDTALVKWLTDETNMPEHVKIEELEFDTVFNFKSRELVFVEDTDPYYGMVLEQRDGLVEIAWFDGTVSMVDFNKIQLIDGDDDEASDGDDVYMEGTTDEE